MLLELVNQSMKNMTKVIIGTTVIMIPILFSACQTPKDKKQECTNQVAPAGYEYKYDDVTEECNLEKIETPVTKEDVIVKWNLPGTAGANELGVGVPTRFQLDSIKKLPGTNNIVLEFQSSDQRGPSNNTINRVVDSLTVWVNERLITIKQGDKALVTDEPTEVVFNKFKDLGLVIQKWQEIIAKAHNKTLRMINDNRYYLI